MVRFAACVCVCTRTRRHPCGEPLFGSLYLHAMMKSICPPLNPPPHRIGVKANPVLSNMKTAPPSSGSGGAAAAVPRKVIGRRASTTQFLTKAVLDVGYIIFLSSFFSSLLLQTRGHWHGVLPYCLPRQRSVEHSYLASPRGLDSAFGVSCTHVR